MSQILSEPVPFVSLFIYLFKWIERENAFTPQFRWIYENIFSEKRQLSERTKTKDNGIGWEQSRLLERFAPVERHASPRAQIVTRLLRRKPVRRMYVGRFACKYVSRGRIFQNAQATMRPSRARALVTHRRPTIGGMRFLARNFILPGRHRYLFSERKVFQWIKRRESSE